jgi:hypothetical protein
MSLQSIQQAFDDFLLAYQSSNVYWEGSAIDPAQNEPFLSTKMAARVRAPRGPGVNAVMMWSGVFVVSIYMPINEGTKPANDKADELLVYFARGTTLSTTDGKRVIVEYATALPSIQFDSWLQVPVEIHWFSID